MSALGGYAPLPFRLGGDATTGWSASQHARASADLACSVRSCPFAWVTMTLNPGSAPTLIGYNAMPGVGALLAPTLIRVADGHARIVWRASFMDAYERSEPIFLGSVKATPCSALARIATAASASDLASADVYIFDSAGTPVNDSVTVYVT
jgi:hypothetical protein